MGDEFSAVRGAVLKRLTKQFGEVATTQDLSEVPYGIGTQSLCLDLALGRPGLPVGRLVEVVGLEGTAKALDVDTPIITPSGWTTMGALQVGDFVFDDLGMPVEVIAATEVMYGHPCRRVQFIDGTSVVADEGHLWQTLSYLDRRLRYARTRDRRRGDRTQPRQWPRRRGLSPHQENGAVRTTKEIAETLRAYDGKGFNHCVLDAQPLEYPEADLPIKPYVLGAWLGDGRVDGARLSSADPQILQEIEEEGYPVRKNQAHLEWAMYGGLQASLRKLGVLGNKHIPEIYLRASVEQRQELLQGLMDTDGSISRSYCEFTSTIPRLFEGVVDLLRGLGFPPSTSEFRAMLNGKDYGPGWKAQFPARPWVFRLKRKAERVKAGGKRRLGRSITACEPVESRPVRCIEVDSPSHLYLAGAGMVPTHNSALSYHLLAETQRKGGMAFLMETEEAMEMARLKQLGVKDNDSLTILHPVSLQDMFTMMEETVKIVRGTYNGPLTFVLDSLASLCTEEETTDAYDKQRVGGHAKFVRSGLRKLLPLVAKHRVLFVIVNQLYEVIDPYKGEQYRAYGGGGPKYRASVRLFLRYRKGEMEYAKTAEGTVDKERALAMRTHVECIKNKVGVPYRKATFRFHFDRGIDRLDDLLTGAEEIGAVARTGSWFTWDGQKFRRDEFRDVVKERYKTWGRAYDALTQLAIDAGKLTPYGVLIPMDETIGDEESESVFEERITVDDAEHEYEEA
jgi:RecA/RadA recombinase